MWLCALLPILLSSFFGATLCGPIPWPLLGKTTHYDRPGDVVIGGSFSILCFYNLSWFDFTAPPARLAPSPVSMWNYLVSQSFVFAIEEINRNDNLLPNLTLGFSIRNSGDSVYGALHETMSFLSGQDDPIPNYTCHLGPRQAALIGDTRSALSVPMASLLGLYKFPQVSYASTLPSLSDKTQFPSFLRTASTDLMGSHMMTQLVLHFGWSWVGILAQDDDFGQEASSLASWELDQSGVCIEFHLHIPSQKSQERIQEIVRRMQSCTATVVLVFLSNTNFRLVLEGLRGLRVMGQVWVSRDALHISRAMIVPGVSQVLHGSYGLKSQRSQVQWFSEFLTRLHPSRNPGDVFTERFWEAKFGCRWPRSNSTVAGSLRICSGNESLTGKEYHVQGMSAADVAYMAVYSIAYALHNLVSCEQGDGPCADPWHFQPWQLLHHLRKVHFKTPDGSKFKFDANGDLVTKFDILEWRKTPEGLFHVFNIGTINPQASLGNRMIFHLKEDVQVPSSVCSPSCPPGFSQTPRQGAPHCCFDCSPCPKGHYADQTDMKSCLLCPEEQYPSHTRNHCLPRTETFLAYDEPLGLTLASASLILAGLAVLVLGVFLKHQNTPVVKANNRALSYVLLASLTLCALCPLLFLGRPTIVTCLLRQTTFAVVFTVAVSSVLAKTLTVALAFRVTRPGDRVQLCLGPSASISVASFTSLIQVILCGVWLGTSPPFPDRDTASEPSHIVIQCQEGSGVAFFCVLGYLGLLAGGTFFVAFLARSLPDAFNETRFITFSMLLFCSVWMAFLPLYHSARGKSTVAVEIFSILASTAGLLGGIFIPKCYIILLKPEQNTLAWLRQRHWSQQERESWVFRAGVSPGPHQRAS